MTIETITWHTATDDPPDDECTVLIKSPRLDPPVWLGYLCAGQWHNVEGFEVRDVTHWAHVPEGPTAALPQAPDWMQRMVA